MAKNISTIIANRGQQQQQRRRRRQQPRPVMLRNQVFFSTSNATFHDGKGEQQNHDAVNKNHAVSGTANTSPTTKVQSNADHGAQEQQDEPRQQQKTKLTANLSRSSSLASAGLRATSKFKSGKGASLTHASPATAGKNSSHVEPVKGPKKLPEYDYSVRPNTYVYLADEDDFEIFKKYPVVNSTRLASLTDQQNPVRPKRKSMLTRDFIDDSLYNPYYGYFSRQAMIYSPEKPFEYRDIKNADDFVNKWQSSYKQYDDVVSGSKKKSEPSSTPLPQLWHTPTELFQPFYGQAIARYLLVNYLLSLYPYQDLVIYEVGGGNGTLMMNILDYIRQTHPDVYARTRYNIIEISSPLAQKQEQNANRLLQDKLHAQGFADKVTVINKSIFDWDVDVPEPCFLIALEVFDNFAHDAIRYNHVDNKPYQGYVVIDDLGDFHEHYSPDLDYWAKFFLQLREQVMPGLDLTKLPGHPLSKSKLRRRIRTWLDPLAHDLTVPEFIPTKYLQFLHVLKRRFPEHRLLASDFTTLPDAIPGYNSPVVQVMLEKKMIPVETYMVLQGYFDILFPTDFELAAELYAKIMGKVATIATHASFLEQWADVDATMTKDGDNPMISFYQNAAFMCT
ncbi:S-adenosyl-L-methionine-dependent methyltransferase [Lipomyces japonicus]|uniref:S-adenosyl-L-methionine-dependent methyltransferase n=1 Tax=Lipomyces japonicus TaxID=56871 RepID=UPI0034CD37F4